MEEGNFPRVLRPVGKGGLEKRTNGGVEGVGIEGNPGGGKKGNLSREKTPFKLRERGTPLGTGKQKIWERSVGWSHFYKKVKGAQRDGHLKRL